MTLSDTLLTVGETDGRALRPESELVAHSQDVGWRSLRAAVFREASLYWAESALDHPFIIYHITHPNPAVYLRRSGYEAVVGELYGATHRRPRLSHASPS